LGIGVEAEVTDSDLSLVGNMGSDPGGELQVVHPFHLSGLLAIVVADLTIPFIEGEAFQGQKRPDHVFSDPLGLGLYPGPDTAVHVEAGVAPGEKAFCPFRAQQLLVDQKRKNLPSEELSQSGIVNTGDLMELPSLIHSSLGHQVVQLDGGGN